MCATCGCSGTIGAETAAALASHEHGQDHEHDREHTAAHDHAHEHGHAHAHDHDHVHDDDHGHPHAHEHEHGPVHEHTHDHGHAHDHGPTHAHTAPDSTVARTLQLEQEILGKNRLLAERNRGWLEGREIFAVNLMSSPGSGKTTLLERTIRDLGQQVVVSVVEGDQETRLDAERIRGAGARVVQINTGTGCHLDAQMLVRALHELSPATGSLLFIENVGNLVCPALFDLGEAARVVIASTTEGEDKPLKYPHMFRAAELIVLNKVDLLPHLSFDVGRFVAHVRRVNPTANVVEVSATRGDGLPEWYRWLISRRSVSRHAT
jgi:hydrogenase nickel incorporation protein HypB